MSTSTTSSLSTMAASSAAVPLMDDDDTIGFGEEGNVSMFKHKYVVLFHLLFRISALVVYMFCTWFSDGFITSFVLTIILLALDFWTVKNITGRILVGLRWWSYVDSEGKSHWKYESRKEGLGRKIQPMEARVFWVGLLVFPAIWTLLFIVAIFRFSFRWLIIDCIALSLNGANVYGYLRCRWGANLTGAAKGYANSFMVSTLVPNILRSNIPSGSQQVI